MSDAQHPTARLTPSISPEHARDARARAWAFVFECYARKKGARPGAPNDGEESKNDPTAEPNYRR